MNQFSRSRRRLSKLLLGIPASLLMSNAKAQDPNRSSRILVVGDSLSAEYGIARRSGWVSLLSQALSSEQPSVTVINARISGDTTSGGLARLSTLLEKQAPTIVVIELGANDALRGLPLAMTQKNLSEMVSRAQAIGAKVLLIGMQIPPNYGREYAQAFKNVFSDTVQHTQSALVPFLFEGFADQRQYFQADGIHPNESAQPLMLKNVRQALDPMLR